MRIEYPFGATPLNRDEIEGLLHSVSTQAELNELEKSNLKSGLEWAEKSRFLKRNLLTDSGIRKLHQKLFGNVWNWAGQQRVSEKNIGVAPHLIAQEIHTLCEDVQFWIENETYDWDEIGARFHHRLVFIHPFPNGNGRLARIACDLLFLFNKHAMFTWGSEDLVAEGDLRRNYISALREADRGIYDSLIKFVRT